MVNFEHGTLTEADFCQCLRGNQPVALPADQVQYGEPAWRISGEPLGNRVGIQLNIAAGLAAKQHGMSIAEFNVGDDWNDYADGVADLTIGKLKAAGRDTLSMNDLWREGLQPPPNHPNAIGSVLPRAAKRGLLEATDLSVRAEGARRKANKVGVWRIV